MTQVIHTTETRDYIIDANVYQAMIRDCLYTASDLVSKTGYEYDVVRLSLNRLTKKHLLNVKVLMLEAGPCTWYNRRFY